MKIFKLFDRHCTGLTRLVLGAVLSASALGASAQDFPAKPIELSVLFPAGSSADVVARVLADGMSKQLGQPVLVMNRPGAGGAIGYRYVQGQKPDGYSLVFSSNSISTVYYSGQVPFTYKAFEPVAKVTSELPVLAVRADSPWNNLKDMIAAVRAKPGSVRVGNSGTGSFTHISAVGFFTEIGGDVTHVPFGSAQVVTSLLGNHIEAVVQAPGALTAHVRAGALKVLGVLASAREPAFPNVQTAAEQGIPYQSDMWRGIAAPKGTPRPVILRLEAALRNTVNSPEFRAQGDKMGFMAAFAASDDFGRLIAEDDRLVERAMDKAGLLIKK
jgi:tripartite-type tricarboxylate transporter receptor subunit TctC